MITIVRSLAYAATILSLACVIGCRGPSHAQSGRTRGLDWLAQAQAQALSDMILLEELRANRHTNAIELLEEDVDTQVLTIDRLKNAASELEAEQASSTLRVLEEYRSTHPRETEARIEGIEHLDPFLQQIQERVRQILRDARATGVQPLKD